MTNTLFILGAADPEMQAIESLLKATQHHFVYAAVDGVRVHPGNAYKANGTLGGILSGADHVVFVECNDDLSYCTGCSTMVLTDSSCSDRDVQTCPLCGWTAKDFGDVEYTTIDHHRPGDPGYGLPPEKYWLGSSLGQVWAYLDSLPEPACFPFSKDLLLIAAADHCLAAAYRGECRPNVDPDDLMKWRAESRAKFQNRPVAEVLADVEAARTKLREALYNRQTDRYVKCSICNGQCDHPWGDARPRNGCPACVNGFALIADLRGQNIPELPEAAARENIPFLAQVKDRDGREKISLMCAKPEMVERFLSGEFFSGEEQLVDMYGDPARGFAGGYINR